MTVSETKFSAWTTLDSCSVAASTELMSCEASIRKCIPLTSLYWQTSNLTSKQMATEEIPVVHSTESLYNSLFTNCFHFKYCNFCKAETQIIIGICIFKIKEKCQSFNDVLKMKTKYYIFLVMNLKTERHVRQSQEPSNSCNSDSKMFHFPGFISMPKATVQQWTMPLTQHNTSSIITGQQDTTSLNYTHWGTNTPIHLHHVFCAQAQFLEYARCTRT